VLSGGILEVGRDLNSRRVHPHVCAFKDASGVTVRLAVASGKSTDGDEGDPVDGKGPLEIEGEHGFDDLAGGSLVLVLISVHVGQTLLTLEKTGSLHMTSMTALRQGLSMRPSRMTSSILSGSKVIKARALAASSAHCSATGPTAVVVRVRDGRGANLASAWGGLVPW